MVGWQNQNPILRNLIMSNSTESKNSTKSPAILDKPIDGADKLTAEQLLAKMFEVVPASSNARLPEPWSQADRDKLVGLVKAALAAGRTTRDACTFIFEAGVFPGRGKAAIFEIWQDYTRPERAAKAAAKANKQEVSK
jgi:hypothetical protein